MDRCGKINDRNHLMILPESGIYSIGIRAYLLISLGRGLSIAASEEKSPRYLGS